MFQKGSLTSEQYKVYEGIMHFCMGVSADFKMPFVADLNKLILSLLPVGDYPTTSENVALLIGNAGTGKTFMIKKIVSSLTTFNKKICVLAPTNKALKILQSQFPKYPKVSFQTISKFLEQDIEYTPEGASVYKTKLKQENIKDIGFIIIDEVSMVSSKNWKDLNKYVLNRIDAKMLLVGDNCQLPPVMEEQSVIFDIPCRKFHLNAIVRTKHIEMASVYERYRESVITNTPAEVIESKHLRVVSEIKEFDITTDKILTYSNEKVDYYNNIVRSLVFKTQEKYIIGEKLIFNSSVKVAMDSQMYVCFYANDELTVESIGEHIIYTASLVPEKFADMFPNEFFKVITLHGEVDDEMVSIHKVKDKEKMTQYFDNVKILIKRENDPKKLSKLWNFYYILQNTIDTPVKYSYASTVYKAQGSTYKNIYVDKVDIQNCCKGSLLFKTLYTAMTRASDTIYLYKQQYYDEDVAKWPFIKRAIDPSELKVGMNIMYATNEYKKAGRKLVRCTVMSIGDKIVVGNPNFKWNLKDVQIYG